MSREENLGYLAGLLDGEGCIGLPHTASQKGNRSVYYNPRISIYNTNHDIIAEVGRVLKDEGLAYYINTRPGTDKFKTTYTINIVGFIRCLRFLLVMEPHMRAKRKHARYLMAFIWGRMRDRLPWTKNHYKPEDLELIEIMKTINARGPVILREHTSDVEQYTTKMCSELRAKGAEVTEMLTRTNSRWAKCVTK